MKRLFILLLLPVFARAQTNRALTGTYQDGANNFTIAKPCKEVWASVKDAVEENGYQVKMVDSSFLLVSAPVYSPATFEKADGTLKDPDASFVVPTIWDNNNGNWELRTPARISFQYVIHLTGCSSEKTTGEIELIKIRAERMVQNGLSSDYAPLELAVKSTGIFEAKLYDEIE